MKADDVLDFWYGDVREDVSGLEERYRMWYRSTSEEDREIEARFAEAVEEAAAGRLDDWRAAPRGALALIVLLDQFSRNIYRRTARAFANDERAREICREALDRGAEDALGTLERVFLYSPLHHSETLADQDECGRRFEALVAGCEPALRSRLEESLGFVVEHRDVVARFGRFPHRNEVLGRTSTPDEIAYLASGARTYGQGPPGGEDRR